MSETSTWHPSEAAGVLILPELPQPLPRAFARRRRLMRGTATAAGVVGLILSVWWVTNSQIFDLRSLQVSGTRHLSAARVAQVAELTRGTNVLWLSPKAIERRLERDPWVLRATVSRTLPSSVTISVRERYPIAVVQGAVLLLVAEDGAILGRARGPVHLPMLSGVRPPASGNRLPTSLPGLAVARTLSVAMRGSVLAVTETSPGFLTLLTREGVTVLYGDASQAAAKAEALQAVLSWAYRQGIAPASVDVRAPSAPALLRKGTRPSPPAHPSAPAAPRSGPGRRTA